MLNDGQCQDSLPNITTTCLQELVNIPTHLNFSFFSNLQPQTIVFWILSKKYMSQHEKTLLQNGRKTVLNIQTQKYEKYIRIPAPFLLDADNKSPVHGSSIAHL